MPLSDSDRALALLARDDVAFGAFPPDGVVLVVGYDPVQVKYGFDSQNRPLDPAPAYALGAERTLVGGVGVQRGEIPQSCLRIASYAGPSAPAARLAEAEAIARRRPSSAGRHRVGAIESATRRQPARVAGRSLALTRGGDVRGGPSHEDHRARLVVVAGRDCACLRPADVDPGIQISQALAGPCGSRPRVPA